MTNSEIQIRIIGKIGNENLTPANFDIAQIKVLFDSVETLLYPEVKSRKNRPVIAFEQKSSSVINVFRTSLQRLVLNGRE